MEKKFECDICKKRFRIKSLLEKHLPIHQAGERSHICHVCGTGFMSQLGLTKHQNIHFGEKGFRCEVCEKGFLTKGNYKLHLATHNKGKNIKCQICNYKTNNKVNLRKHVANVHEKLDRLRWPECLFCKKKVRDLVSHMRVHSREKPFFCKFCPVEFAVNGNLLCHAKRLHNPNRKLEVRCPLCPKLFFNNSDFRSHLLTHTGEKAYKCGDCGKAFRTNAHLTTHRQGVHSNRRPFKCEECGKRFKLNAHLTIHKKLHDPNLVKKFECQICKKAFRMKHGLKNHLVTHQANRERSHKCHVCGKGYTSKRSLELHLQYRHFRKKPFHCKICNKKFQIQSTLKRHFDSHNKEKVINCQLCNFKTNTENNLKCHVKNVHGNPDKFRWSECLFCKKKVSNIRNHTRAHTRETPYFCRFCPAGFSTAGNRASHEERLHNPNRKRELECPLCPKLFFESSSLKAHLRTHTGEKAYKCGECGKEFGTGAQLRSHLSRIHSNSRPFKCGECNKSFKLKSILNLHKEACHGGNVVNCQFCNFKTNTKRNLRTHCKTIHPTQISEEVGL